MTTGIERRNEGWSAVQTADVAINRSYGDYYRQALDEHIATGREFTADDIRDRAEELAPRDAAPHSPNLLPAILGSATRNHRIAPVAFTKAGRRTRHGSRNLIFRGVRSNAA